MRFYILLAYVVCVQGAYLHLHNWLTPDECAGIENFAFTYVGKIPSFSSGNSYWNNKVVYLDAIATHNATLHAQLTAYIERLRPIVQENWGVSAKDVGHYTMTVTLWQPDMELGPHADNAFWPSGEPNYVPNRTYSVTFYTSPRDQYKGGDFYFLRPEPLPYPSRTYIEEIVPVQRGDVLIFGAGLDYVHGVTKVLEGKLVTVSLWFERTN